MTQKIELSKDYALNKDKTDSLKNFRHEFFISTDNTIYLDGNSLGRMPKKTADDILHTAKNEWGTELIESWNKNWYFKSLELGNKIAKVIGASEGEVIVCDNTSVNLYKLIFAALKFNSGKSRVVSDVFNFPSDLYILQGVIQQTAPESEIVLANSRDGISIDLNDLKTKIDKNTALVALSLVSFKSSFFYNAQKITDWAHKKGALVLWDVSHAAGAVPINLNKTNADLAVGCTYKFLNGGPGSPAFLYVKTDLQHKLESPIWGWFAHKKPFQFDLNFEPSNGIEKFLSGTPAVISQTAINSGIDMVLRAGVNNLREKSIQLSEYFIFLIENKLKNSGFSLGSPREITSRGSHVSLVHREAYRICQALIQPKNQAVKIIPDFREPTIIRFGITPLYTTFEDIWRTVERLNQLITNKEFEDFSIIRKTVT